MKTPIWNAPEPFACDRHAPQSGHEQRLWAPPRGRKTNRAGWFTASLMEGYIRFIVRYRFAVVAATFVITAILASQLRYLHVEMREHAILPQNHPYVRLHNHIMDTFGGDTTIVVGVIPKHSDVFAPYMLEKIRRITKGIQQLPNVVPGSVVSMAAERVKIISGHDDAIEVLPLMSAVPRTSSAIDALRQRVLGEKIYRDTLVAADGSAAAIVVDFDVNVAYHQMVDDIESVVARERDDETDVPTGGGPVIAAAADDYTATMAVLFPIAVFVIALVHFEAFRTIQAMVLPLVTALLSVIWAVGIMGALRHPLDTWSAVTPVVILAVAAGHAVQILKRYYEEYTRLRDSTEAVVCSVIAVGPTMLTAGLIAAAGFGSLATVGVAGVRVLGLLLALGILSALVIEMTFTPACRVMLPAPRGHELARERNGRLLGAALETITELVVARPRAILVAAAALATLACAGAWSLRVDNSFSLWFPASSAVRRAQALLNAHLAGTSTITLMIDGTEDGDIKRPDVLSAMSDLQSFIEAQPDVGAATSIVDYLKLMHGAMQAEPSSQALPDNEPLVAQYLLLYSMSGSEFASLVDASYRQAVIRAFVKRDDAEFGRSLLRRIESYAMRRFDGLPATVRFAGGSLGTQTAMNESVVREKVINVCQVTAIIFVLSALALRSLVGGIIVLVPLLLAIVVNLGVMGWSGTALSVATASITSMAISIGADFAIYLIYRIHEEIGRCADVETAVRTSLLTSGKAIFFVSSAVVLGYLVLALSSFSAWVHLGVLTALMITVSAVATVTVIPALFIVMHPVISTPVDEPVMPAEPRAMAG